MLNRFKSRLELLVKQIPGAVGSKQTILFLVALSIVGVVWFVQLSQAQRQLAVVQSQNQNLQSDLEKSTAQLASSAAALNELQSADQQHFMSMVRTWPVPVDRLRLALS